MPYHGEVLADGHEWLTINSGFANGVLVIDLISDHVTGVQILRLGQSDANELAKHLIAAAELDNA